MLQRWESLTFLHWSYDAQTVRALLPKALVRSGVELDVFDGRAWVGLVPFVVSGVRLPGTPALPWLSRFPETNVRTYLRGHDGQPAVWFFTLEADRLAAVLAARSGFGLLYRWAQMSVAESADGVHYRSSRHRLYGRGDADILVSPGNAVKAGSLAEFLTARFRLYSTFGSRVAYANIEHAAWPLQEARAIRIEQNLFENSGVPHPVGDPVVQFARSLDVRIGYPHLL